MRLWNPVGPHKLTEIEGSECADAQTCSRSCCPEKIPPKNSHWRRLKQPLKTPKAIEIKCRTEYILCVNVSCDRGGGQDTR